jgi:hypothetical protein
MFGQPDGVVTGRVHDLDAFEGAFVDGLKGDSALGPREELQHASLHRAGLRSSGAIVCRQRTAPRHSSVGRSAAASVVSWALASTWSEAPQLSEHPPAGQAIRCDER